MFNQVAEGIVQNMDWTVELVWTVGLDSWTGQDSWTGLIFTFSVFFDLHVSHVMWHGTNIVIVSGPQNTLFP